MDKYWCYVILIELLAAITNSFPTNFPTVNLDTIHVPSSLSVNNSQILGFMRRFGYLNSTSTTSASETLYQEDAFIFAVKQMQRYGALNETGELDNATVKLLTMPRCGVPDIARRSLPGEGKRHRRFVLGSQGWQKRRITYFISNWSPQVGKEKVATGMEQAFDLWSKYSGLRFERVFHSNADIIVAFGSGFHGDSFPFDGPGRILAHAFFPYEMTTLGGDIHFDNDENWKENAPNLAEGVDFRSVAVHELGHSLGLAHSSALSSIMFPYYKGPEQSKDLDYDDIMALYELYIRNRVGESDPGFDSGDADENENDNENPTEESSADQITKTTRIVNKTPASLATTEPTVSNGPTMTGSIATNSKNVEFTSLPTVDFTPHIECEMENRHHFSIQVKCSAAKKDSVSAVQNLCSNLRFDSIASIRGEIFIFKGTYVWRFTEEFQLIPGYPTHFRYIFPGIPSYVEQIDAAYERYTDGVIILFSGKMFWEFDGANFTENSPRSISEYGFDEDTRKVDAALVWSKNGHTYIFSGTKYIRFDEERHSVDGDYPKEINEKWRGIPNNLDASVSMDDDKTYFFKGDLFWLYNDQWIRPQNGYPRRTSISWLGCSN